ncbi:MAG: hypothetical protein SPJ04_06170 [Bdellovibrionota bacterium]|nr:hypothetical protein [Pseudomonadota bacterium]MDY6090822.1 hypothetical protein [Bdellovibrionota bacterium]
MALFYITVFLDSYLVRYQIIITKGNKSKTTKWSKRVLVEI